LNGESELSISTYTPNIHYNSKWVDQLNHLKIRKEQTQVNLEWEEFYIRICHIKALYKEISVIDNEKKRKKRLSDLIKQSIPNYFNLKNQLCEFSRWKRFYKLIVLLIEDSTLSANNISLEFCFQQFRGLGLTVNYLCEVKEQECKNFLDYFVLKCVERYKKNN
ncbi:16703_t:CDS:1, partial [Dentiscutata heterogama]